MSVCHYRDCTARKIWISFTNQRNFGTTHRLHWETELENGTGNWEKEQYCTLQVLTKGVQQECASMRRLVLQVVASDGFRAALPLSCACIAAGACPMEDAAADMVLRS